jgi:GntR family transcriptional regulator
MVTFRLPPTSAPAVPGAARSAGADTASHALPLHERVAAAVRRAIASGEVGPGDALPTARELADVFAVHPNTVLRAYRSLRDEGTIELRAGRGAHVSRAVTGRTGSAVVGQLALRSELDALVLAAARQGVGQQELVSLVRSRHAALASRDDLEERR